jgi:hypothetical protein
MLAYHGTSLEYWESIRSEGLVPRGHAGPSNWKNSIESNPDTVYLTIAYAMGFGMNALELSEDVSQNKVVIIEVETDTLPGVLVPDEDALEQVGRRSNDGLDPAWGMVQRTKWYRKRVREYAESGLDFAWSMSVLGTGGHIGPIPASHFTRAAIIDIREEAALSLEALDRPPSVLAYRVLGDYLRGLQAQIFGDPYTMTDLLSMSLTPPPIGRGIQVINFGREHV